MTIFAEHITKEKSLVYDLRVILNDEQRYFILKVIPTKRLAFLNAVKKDFGFCLEDYGEILYRGWDEPDDNLKALLHEQYGMYY